MVIRVFIASLSGSVVIKKRQQEIVGFLEANRIPFEVVDITMLEDQRLWMYRNLPEGKHPDRGNPLPPQIFNGQQYCGDYEDFFQSKETNTVFSFLGLPSKGLVKVRYLGATPCWWPLEMQVVFYPRCPLTLSLRSYGDWGQQINNGISETSYIIDTLMASCCSLVMQKAKGPNIWPLPALYI
uniref:SH3 domain binding glutamate-rich protein like 2 n=1 Tax=Paramormyrops kingsleyae TaxID=1676925 RepID=A0A3B3QSD4_9TELE